MRVISKTISYDDLISRVPGVIPSIIDSWTVPYVGNCSNSTEDGVYYSYNLAVRKAREYNVNPSEISYGTEFTNFNIDNLREFTSGNYGLIPSDIIIPKSIASTITDYTDIYVNLPNGNGGYYDLSWPKKPTDPHYKGRKIVSGSTDEEIKILRYYTFNKWYIFFNDYYKLISSPEYERTYTSAIDYYEKEVKVKNDEQYEYYSNLDTVFNSRGGEAMYKWMSNNCVIQFNIPKEYTEKWGTTSMYLTDALKWYWWFNERVDKYSGVTTLEDCKETDDCCDSEKYINLGGKGFFDTLSEWVDSISDFSPNATKSASITIPITITASIDDLGEMSIFSSDWEEGVDYHNTLGNSGGTVVNRPYEYDVDGDKVYVDDTVIIKVNDNTGYKYNNTYGDISYDDEAWESYTNYYISGNTEQFASNGISQDGNFSAITSYAYSPINGEIVYNPSAFTSIVSYEAISAVSINGITNDVIDGEYLTMCYDDQSVANIAYKNGTKLPVYNEGGLKYVIVNGKRKYAEKDSNGNWRVYFFKCYDKDDPGCPISKGTYIIQDGVLYLTNSGNITITEHETDTKYVYPVMSGYFDFNGTRLYVSGKTGAALNGVLVPDGYTYNSETDTYTYNFRQINNDELKALGLKSLAVNYSLRRILLAYDFDRVNCTVISGYCDSKLDLLRRKEISTDDLGNELPGHFTSLVDYTLTGTNLTNQTRYNNAYLNCTLDILYKVGEVLSPSPNEFLPYDGKFDYFDGDIIDSIEFYYKDVNGNKQCKVSASGTGETITAITSSKALYEDSDIKDTIIDKMYCDITYYMGAVLKRRRKDTATMYELADDNYHKGIKYVDTVSVEKKSGNYYLGNGKTFMYNYYELKQEPSSVHISDFNTDVTTDASTYFEMRPMLYVMKGNNIEKVSGSSSTYYAGWEENNNVVVAPLVRSEFNLASSYPQSVDANIYIDRGINAAFEKHLKLQEIKTMEALETFSNGIFKMNNY